MQNIIARGGAINVRTAIAHRGVESPKSKPNLKKPLRRRRSALQEVVQDGQRLADYLYGRGRLGSHVTSGNAALVLQTLPQARAVLTAKDWDKFGRRVNKGAKGIPQLVRVNGYYNVGSIFDVSMTYGNKPYPIPEIKPEQMDKAIKELERLSPVNIIFQNEGVVRYDAEQHAIVFPTAMPQREVLARLPAEIVIATAEQHTPGISQAPLSAKNGNGRIGGVLWAVFPSDARYRCRYAGRDGYPHSTRRGTQNTGRNSGTVCDYWRHCGKGTRFAARPERTAAG